MLNRPLGKLLEQRCSYLRYMMFGKSGKNNLIQADLHEGNTFLF